MGSGQIFLHSGRNLDVEAGKFDLTPFLPVGGHIIDRGETKVTFDKELDTRGLSCPLPVLKTKKALNGMTSGQVLKIVATDPGSVKDMQAFSRQTANPLLASPEETDAFVFLIHKH